METKEITPSKPFNDVVYSLPKHEGYECYDRPPG